MSMPVKTVSPAAAAHAAVLENAKECNILLHKTNKIMLKCVQAQIECAKATQEKKLAFAEANQDLERIRMALQNLVFPAELQGDAILAVAPIQRYSVGGLPNLGNTCYLNAAIQGLLASPQFANSLSLLPNHPLIQALRSIANTKDLPTESTRLRASLLDLRNLLIADRANPDLYLARGTAEDSAAAFEAILRGCRYSLRLQTTVSAAEVPSSVQNQRINIVHLPIYPHLSLQQIINVEFSPKQQNDPNNAWRATLNQGRARLVTHYTIRHQLLNPAPNLLVFQYARAHTDNRNQNAYNDQSVDCQLEIDMTLAFGSQTNYRLVASVNHHYPNPHYTAYVRKDHQWYHCDDSDVSIAPSPHLDKAALLIFEKL